MTELNKSRVIYCPTEADAFGDTFEKQFRMALKGLAQSLDCEKSSIWAVKVPLGGPGKALPVPSNLLKAAKSALQNSGFASGPFFDNLSITTEGLDTPEGLVQQAHKMGLIEFQVGDEAEGQTLLLDEGSSMDSVKLSAVAADAGGLLLLNSVRPNPFMGLSGAMTTMGNGLMDRETKLRLHRDVKPTVDTPLCAGCGSCLSSCIFDAIVFSSGRAMIDHKICVGCGECMSACHLGGIGPENGMSIPRYQKLVAEAAGAVALKSVSGASKSIIHVNFLTPMSSQAGGSFGRDRFLKGHFGALMSTDPVALDQATWDLLVKGAVHGLRQWSGFLTEPTPLMERSEALGIGRRQYELETHS